MSNSEGTGSTSTSGMNCFEWQFHASDHLDGTLIASLKRDADAHLETCTDCHQRYDRFRLIVTAIANQPRAVLPRAEGSAVPRSPAEAAAANKRISLRPAALRKAILAKWERIPWYLRASVEGIGIIFVILIGISAGPKLRNAYERSVEKSLDEYNDVLSDPNRPAPARAAGNGAAESTGGPAAEVDEFAAGESGTHGADAAENGEEVTEGESDADDASSGSGSEAAPEIRVGNSEIWRFNLKTDSPREFQQKIIQILANLKISEKYAGIEAPGGIQFDLIVPKSAIPALKQEIEKIAPEGPQDAANNPLGETFTWYMNKSRSKIPDGKTRVVIWLSQM